MPLHNSFRLPNTSTDAMKEKPRLTGRAGMKVMRPSTSSG